MICRLLSPSQIERQNLAPRIVDLRALLPTADAAKAEPAYLFLCPGWAARPQGGLISNSEASEAIHGGAIGRASKRKSLADALFEEHSGLDWDTKVHEILPLRFSDEVNHPPLTPERRKCEGK